MLNTKLIRSLRETHMKTITEMSKYLGYETPTAFWLIEQGKRNISVEALYKIAKLFKVPMEDFVLEDKSSA